MVASSTSPSSRPCSVAHSSLAGRAGHAFTPQAMLQGFACHARGVELTLSTSRAHARIRSKRTHDVHLRADRGRLLVACSCPARSLGLEVCKHTWAALLEVDRQQGLTDLRRSRGLLSVEAVPMEDASNPTEPARPEPTQEAPRRAGRGTKVHATATEPAREQPAQARRSRERAARHEDDRAQARKSDTRAKVRARPNVAPRASAKRAGDRGERQLSDARHR